MTEDTIIVVTSDHGSGVARYKRMPYDSGLHVPQRNVNRASSVAPLPTLDAEEVVLKPVMVMFGKVGKGR